MAGSAVPFARALGVSRALQRFQLIDHDLGDAAVRTVLRDVLPNL
jgi:hypothetical protein